MNKLLTIIIILLLLPTICTAQNAAESEQIVVRLETEVQLMPLYLAQFANDHSALSASYIKQLEDILHFDLNHNGLTYTVTQTPEKERIADQLLNSAHASNANDLKAFYLIKVNVDSNKKLSAILLSINASTEKGVDGLPLVGEIGQDRRQIHQLADALHKTLFDKEGIATTHVLYTIKKKIGEKKWVSEIWEADYDGENARPIIKDGTFNLSPVYIPPKSGGRSGNFFYVSYRTSQPKIYIASLKDGTSKRFSTLRGNQLMPTISRQRDKVSFICDITGNPDLFLQPFNTEVGALGKPQQIFATKQATQGTPTFSSDGKRIAFVSNKDGSPRIYMMNIPAPGTPLKAIKAELVTKHSKESSAPTWSPDGNKLAYCAMTNGVRQIWVYDFNSKEERQVTQGPVNKENPTWAPNSLNLMYNSSDAGACDLYLINLNQPKATKITSGPGEKRFPNWEPLKG